MYRNGHPRNNPINEPGVFSLSARPLDGPGQFRESASLHVVFNKKKTEQWDGDSSDISQRSNKRIHGTHDTASITTRTGQKAHFSGQNEMNPPVLRNMEICLAYSTGLEPKGPEGYAPYPSWRKEPDNEFFQDDEVYENRTFKEYKPYPSWVNGSGNPVHPSGHSSEAQICSMPSGSFYISHQGDNLYTMSVPGTAGDCEAQSKRPKKMKPRKQRPIIFDGNSVAMWHGNHAIFSAQGIHICVEFFRARGHKNITVYVPDLKSSNSAVLHSEVLDKFEEDGTMQYVPVNSHVNRKGVRIISNDNRKFILQKAVEQGAVIVSNENYQELYEDARDSWRERLNEGILQFDFETPEEVTFKSDRKKQTKTIEEILTF